MSPFTGFAILTFDAFFRLRKLAGDMKRSIWGKGFATEAPNACLKYEIRGYFWLSLHS